MKNKKIVWISLLIVGIIPFAIPLIAGIYDFLTGFSGLCFIECDNYYGFKAFIDSIYFIFVYILANIYYRCYFNNSIYNKIKKQYKII